MRLVNHLTQGITLPTWVAQLQGLVFLGLCPFFGQTRPKNAPIFQKTFGEIWKCKIKMTYFSNKIEESFVGIYFSQLSQSFLYLIIDTVKNKRWSKRIYNLDLIANFSFLKKLGNLAICLFLEITKIKNKDQRKT